MSWDTATVYNVQRLRAGVSVADEALVLARDPQGLLDAIGTNLFAELREAATTLAVDIQERDCHLLRGSRDPAGMTTQFHIYWNPKTETVELHGGPEDGQVLTHRGAPRLPLKVATYRNPAFVPDLTPLPLTPVGIDHVVYDFAGWNPHTRRWVYQAQL